MRKVDTGELKADTRSQIVSSVIEKANRVVILSERAAGARAKDLLFEGKQILRAYGAQDAAGARSEGPAFGEARARRAC